MTDQELVTAMVGAFNPLFDAADKVKAMRDATPPMFRFNGPAYVPERDDVRLTGQLLRIFSLMKDGKWRTLPAISNATNDPEASISSQLRHLRKPRFGSHTVERRHVKNGLHEYRLTPNPDCKVIK